MKIVRTLLLAVTFGFVLLTPQALLAESTDTPSFSGWHEGVEGLTAAIKEQAETGKPMFVYFYTTRCGFCRQFEGVLLTDDTVNEYMDSIIAVRLDAEGGNGEAQLTGMYGVNGYPSLFMHSSRSKTVSRVTRMEMKDGKARLLEGADFVKELKNAASR